VCPGKRFWNPGPSFVSLLHGCYDLSNLVLPHHRSKVIEPSDHGLKPLNPGVNIKIFPPYKLIVSGLLSQ
jgi:hypothetical protein